MVVSRTARINQVQKSGKLEEFYKYYVNLALPFQAVKSKRIIHSTGGLLVPLVT
jgi:hypothetical protein